ncbi:HNH endonuclease [Rhodohalobacter sp. 8-1]|uniref:HNH endonuclease n=1 Tax=Rhodohalobacter sp. 8-1 TaxID=3131972 RepID=UPI0030EECD67
MSIDLRTHKILWAKSGNRCAYEGCKNELVIDETITDDDSIIGEEAHIVARKENGPRGNHDLSQAERDEYSNLILLCRNHHKEIDDQVKKYTVEALLEMKRKHEKWVKANLEFGLNDVKIDLKYSNYLDEIIKMADFNGWNNWTSYLLSSGQPSINKKQYESLQKIPEYIVNRYWPRKYPELESAIYNFKNVLNSLTKVFDKYKEERNGELWTRKFYKIDRYDPKIYEDQLDKFNYHVDLVEDLTLELTRAGNFLCEKIRDTIHPTFREEEGKLLVTSGPDMAFEWTTFTLEYSKEERENGLYPGLQKFLKVRAKRDIHFGEGIREDYWI